MRKVFQKKVTSNRVFIHPAQIYIVKGFRMNNQIKVGTRLKYTVETPDGQYNEVWEVEATGSIHAVVRRIELNSDTSDQIQVYWPLRMDRIAYYGLFLE
jgi:hypothetical protein